VEGSDLRDVVPLVVDTDLGPVEYRTAGEGPPVLVVHGSPGGSDQGLLLGRFLVQQGFRVLAPSRPGYLATPLTDRSGTADGTAALLAALLDVLGVADVGLVSWSGGGPASYRLCATFPDRVRSLVAIAAVSGPYRFATGLAGIESSVMSSGFGGWVLHELAEHAPQRLVHSTLQEEGSLTRAEAAALAAHVWGDPDKREFVLSLSATLSGRNAGLHNDQARFPTLDDLGLAGVAAPTLLVHGTADTDVSPEHSERALAAVADARILRVDRGTHLSVWTDPTSADVQSRAVDHLRGAPAPD